MIYDIKIRESVVKDYFEFHYGYRTLGIKYNVPRETVRSWIDRAKAALSVKNEGVGGTSQAQLINITNEIKEPEKIVMPKIQQQSNTITLCINWYVVETDIMNLKNIIEAMKND